MARGDVAAATAHEGLWTRDFLTLLIGQAASTLGDQVARVAVAVLVFDRSHSPAATAAAYAATYLPWVVAAPFLSGLGDRYPRRRVMVLSDGYRCVVAALLALPGLSTVPLILLVFLLTCGDPPFDSAKSALLPDVLRQANYQRGQALKSSLDTLASFIGFAAGGFLVMGIGARGALLIDAATFAGSAIALQVFVRNSRAGVPAAKERFRRFSGWSIVAGNPAARWALALGAALAALDVVSVALAVPWATQLGHGAALAGLLAATGALGAAIGQFALARASAERRSRLLVPLALITSGLFLPLLATSPIPLALALLFLSGAASSFQNIVNQLFVLAISPAERSRAFGVAGSVINLSQGAAIVLGGLLADHVLPSRVIGLSGAVGVLVTLGLAALRPTSNNDRVPPVISATMS